MAKGNTTVDTPAAGGGVYYSSGLAIIPTSGAPTASGPWMEEHQDLTIDYVRVPWATVSAHTINLSTGSQSHSIVQTRLAIAVTAHYRKEKTYIGHTDPSPSGYQQPQKFQVLAVSADHMGNTYGDLSAGASGTAMGPAGTIITSQPWYQRRKWDATIDTEVNRSLTGYKYFVKKSSCTGFKHVGNSNAMFQTDFEGHAVGVDRVGQFQTCQYMGNDSGARLQVFGTWYPLGGPYSTDQETIMAIFNLIDNLGNEVTTLNYMLEPDSDGNGTPGSTAGFAEYSIARHDYT